MEEIRVGMRFQNRSNGRIGYVAQIDEVGKCADIMYEEVAEGQSKGGRASLSGLKGQKSWKYLHDETETTVEQVEEVKEEEVASDGTPYTEVMAEIQQDEQNLADKYTKKSKKKAEKKQAEQKAEKPNKEKKERKKKEQDENWVDSFEVTLEVLKAFKYDIKRGASNIVILENNEKIAVIYKRKTQIRIYTTPDRYNKLSADLYDRYEESKYKVLKASFFVNTDDIKKVFDIIL